MTTALSSYDTSTLYSAATATATVDTEKVTYSDFLRLLTAQLTSQDPLSPMQDMDFTAQLAQLQALDEQIAMTKTMQSMRIDTQLQAGTNMIGKFIGGVDTAGATASGQVVRVVQSGGSVFVELANGQQVEVSTVTNVWHDATSMFQDLAASAQIVDKYVAGYDADGEAYEGIVEKIQVIDNLVMAKLYNGSYITLDSISELREPTAAEIYLHCIPAETRSQLEAAQALGNKVVTGTTAAGKTVTGMVSGVEFDQNTFEVSLVLYSGDRIQFADLTGDARDPDGEDLARDLGGFWVDGLDEDGNAVGGVVIGAAEKTDGLVLLLADGAGGVIELYFDACTALRDATDDEKAAAGLA